MNTKFPYRYRVLIFLFFLLFITYLDRVSIALLDKWIISEFHLSNTQWGTIGGAFALSYALFEIPSGAWGDHIGQRVTFIRIVLWWSLFTALTGLTAGFISMLLVRFLFGMGEAGAFPNSTAVISKWFPSQETSRGIAIAFSGMYAGMAIAPFIVIAIAEAYGWRSTFIVNGAIGLAWVLVCAYWFKNNPSEMKGITYEEKTLIESNRRYFDHKQKYPWKQILKNQSLLALVMAHSIICCLNYFYVFWMTRYLRVARHASENEIKWTYFLAFSLGTISCFFGGYLSDWIIKRKGVKFGRRSFGFAVLAMPALSILAQALTSNHSIIIVALTTGIAFYCMLSIPNYGTCVDISGNRAATVAGIMNCFGQSAAFIFSITFGKMADTAGFSLPVYILVTALLSGAFLWFVVDPSKPLVANEEVKPVSDETIVNQYKLT
jgi:MFS family permease